MADPLFGFEDIAAFDDEALRTFLDPRDGGIAPAVLGRAAVGCAPKLVCRIRAALPADAAIAFDASHRPSTPAIVERARRHVMEVLFWPLVYWTMPDDYEELIRGEHIHDRIVDELDLSGRDVCDIGAGTGRFTLPAAQRARRVIAVDAVPALLDRLDARARAEGLDNIEIRRGRFAALPLPDGSVDVAVACSAFTSSGPHGGVTALAEAERVVRPGGVVAVIWPQEREWFTERGFEYVHSRGNPVLEFRDVDTAERLCRMFYPAAAARWVRRHRSRAVPYAILGVSPPNDVCIKRAG